MQLIMDRFRVNKLSLNITKTVAMRFWPEGKKDILLISIADLDIPTIHVTKFLGVYLDEDLNWKYHTNQVYHKVQSNKQLLNLAKNFMDVGTLIKIYYTNIYSHLNYGLMV